MLSLLWPPVQSLYREPRSQKPLSTVKKKKKNPVIFQKNPIKTIILFTCLPLSPMLPILDFNFVNSLGKPSAFHSRSIISPPVQRVVWKLPETCTSQSLLCVSSWRRSVFCRSIKQYLFLFVCFGPAGQLAGSRFPNRGSSPCSQQWNQRLNH